MNKTLTRLKDARHPVVIFGGAIGDHLMILPTLRALAQIFPGRLSWLGLPAALKEFYADVPFAKTFTEFMSVMDNGMGGVGIDLDHTDAARALQDCDLLISLSSWYDPAMENLLRALPDAVSLGHFPGFQSGFGLNNYTNMFDSPFRLVTLIDPCLCLEDFAQAPLLKEIYRRPARQVRQALPAGSKVLAVHADTKPFKMWPSERFVTTLDLFLERHPEYEVWVLGQRDLKLHRGKFGKRVHRYLNIPLPATMAMISEADLFLGVDSCLLHVADLFRVPGVGLFGPTTTEEWGFRFTPHRHVTGDGSMSGIEVRDVFGALQTLSLQQELRGSLPFLCW